MTANFSFVKLQSPIFFLIQFSKIFNHSIFGFVNIVFYFFQRKTCILNLICLYNMSMTFEIHNIFDVMCLRYNYNIRRIFASYGSIFTPCG